LKYDINILQAIVVNYFTACLLGFTIQWNSFTINEIISSNWLIYAIIIGTIFILTFQIFAYSSQTAGISITAISSKISVIIPVIIGSFLYTGETLNTTKIVGLILAILSFMLVFYGNDNMKINPRFIFLPVLLFLANGLNDSMMTFAQRKFAGFNTMLFVSCIFFFSLSIGIIWLVIKYITNKQIISLRNIIAGIILGLLNFYSTYYFFKGVAVVDSAVFFPVLNTGIVSISTVIGYFVFKEKLNFTNWIGIFTAIATIIFLTK
jgi:drug/metabolite transporter (DMT)-like permease